MLKRSAAFVLSGSRWLPACSLCSAPRAALAAATSSSRSFSRSARDESKSKRSASSSQYLQRQKKDAFVRARKEPAAGGSGKGKGKGKQREEAPDSLLDAAEGYRSRSAFKLVQLDDKHKFLRAPAGTSGEGSSASSSSPFVVVDLGGAPGGWTQVAVERLERHAARRAGSVKASEDGAAAAEAQATASKPWRVFALDILPMEDVQGAEVMQGNFLLPAVQNELRERIGQPSAAESLGAQKQDNGVVDVVLSDMMGACSIGPVRSPMHLAVRC